MKKEWDLKFLKRYDWGEKRKEIEQAFHNFRDRYKENNEYLDKPEVLKEALNLYEDLIKNFSGGQDEGYYYWLKSSENENDPPIRKKLNEIEDFIKRLANEINFFTIKLGKVSPEKQVKFLNSGILKDYRNFLRRIFETSKYVLTEKEEKILTLTGRTSYDMWVKMVSSLLSKETVKIKDEKGNEKIMTYGELLSMMKSRDKKVRERAREPFEKMLEKYREIAEFEINAVLEDKKVDDELRGFERADKSRHIGDDIESEIVDAMINAVTKGFNISEKYYTFKAKLLGLKKLDYSEKGIEYGEVNKEYPYEEAVKLVGGVFYSIDKEFGEIFDYFINNGFVDAMPKKGKRFGAFCAHNTISQPTYILLNHTNKLHGVLTIGHEAGHGLNNEFMKKKVSAIYFDSLTSTAEVASTFFEDYVLEELLKNAGDEEKIAILMEKLDGDISSIQRQVACYNFEKELHLAYRKEGYLPLLRIEEIFKKHMKSYLGKSVDVTKSGNWWIYWPHIRDYFYVYSYALGLLISKAMQKKLKEDKKFVIKIKKFLSAGSSESPKETFSEMGIDISKEKFWNDGLKKVEETLTQAMALAKKMGKI